MPVCHDCIAGVVNQVQGCALKLVYVLGVQLRVLLCLLHGVKKMLHGVVNLLNEVKTLHKVIDLLHGVMDMLHEVTSLLHGAMSILHVVLHIAYAGWCAADKATTEGVAYLCV